MITIKNASIYSMKGKMAYQLDYSDGSSVRAVESPGKIICKEYKAPGKDWKQVGKPYKIEHNKTRQAERIKEEANKFLGN